MTRVGNGRGHLLDDLDSIFLFFFSSFTILTKAHFPTFSLSFYTLYDHE